VSSSREGHLGAGREAFAPHGPRCARLGVPSTMCRDAMDPRWQT
jgi:hypothetical protein